MPQEEIIITIDTDGAVQVKVEGHAGTGCHALTAPIQAALGETVSDQNTPEFHQRAGARQSAREVAANRR